METELVTYDQAEESIEGQSESLVEETADMKKCPFCAEQIQEQAVKCRYCGEFLDGSSRVSSKKRSKKWYFATPSVVVALLCVGPLALPLVWLNPNYKLLTKMIITVVVAVVTVLCIFLMSYAYQQFLKQFELLGL